MSIPLIALYNKFMGSFLQRLYRVLIGCVIGLVLVILVGSLYAVIGPKKLSTEISQSSPKQTNTSNEQYFSGLGRIRANTADPEPAAVVVSIVFPYNKEDIAFTEELSTHIPQFKELAVDYFASQSVKTLKALSEETIKAELLNRFNKLLRLGSIKILYFNDYLIIE